MFVKGKISRYKFLDEILPGVTNLFRGKTLLVSKLAKERLYLVSDELYSTFQKMEGNPYSIGFFFAEVDGKNVTFSLGVADKYVKFGRKIVVVNKYGQEKFLYKRNLMGKHIVRFTKDIKKGDLVVVVNKWNDVLGFGESLFSADNLPKEGRAINHISDKGFFVKH